MRDRSIISVLLLSVVALFAVGCDSHTCQNACAQYYGTADGQCSRASVLTDGTTPEIALRNCADDCSDALYRTTATSTSVNDAGGYSRLENELDAIDFVDCVVDKDYSSEVFNDTCEDLFFDCPWIKW